MYVIHVAGKVDIISVRMFPATAPSDPGPPATPTVERCSVGGRARMKRILVALMQLEVGVTFGQGDDPVPRRNAPAGFPPYTL